MKFKIKKQEYENRTFRLPVELLEQLNKLASDKNISLNQLVVQCCEYAIDIWMILNSNKAGVYASFCCIKKTCFPQADPSKIGE